jgi:lactoylglutathione lyase
MPKEPFAFTELFPIVSTTDMTRALGFYHDLLGGMVVYEFPGPEGATVYVGLDVGESHIGIGFSPDLADSPRPRAMSLWLYTNDCVAAVERLRSSGITVTEEPTDQPWGERVARVLDPDGNEVVIGQHAAT